MNEKKKHIQYAYTKRNTTLRFIVSRAYCKFALLFLFNFKILIKSAIHASCLHFPISNYFVTRNNYIIHT